MGVPLFGQEHVDRYRETDGEEGHVWPGTCAASIRTPDASLIWRRPQAESRHHQEEAGMLRTSRSRRREPRPESPSLRYARDRWVSTVFRLT